MSDGLLVLALMVGGLCLSALGLSLSERYRPAPFLCWVAGAFMCGVALHGLQDIAPI